MIKIEANAIKNLIQFNGMQVITPDMNVEIKSINDEIPNADTPVSQLSSNLI